MKGTYEEFKEAFNKVLMYEKENKNWIQDANVKKGELHKDLGIPQDENIPTSLLNKIANAEVGETIENPTKKGKNTIRVTRKLKQRVNFAKNVRKKK